MKASPDRIKKEIRPYTTFLGLVNALMRLDYTPSTWEQLSEEEQEEVAEILSQVSNAIGELKRINPKRWDVHFGADTRK